MPPNTVYVGRGTDYGNPFEVSKGITPEMAVARFGAHLRDYFSARLKTPRGKEELDAYLAPLRGKNLACWCPLDQCCHADVLLQIANDDRLKL